MNIKKALMTVGFWYFVIISGQQISMSPQLPNLDACFQNGVSVGIYLKSLDIPVTIACVNSINPAQPRPLPIP